MREEVQCVTQILEKKKKRSIQLKYLTKKNKNDALLVNKLIF